MLGGGKGGLAGGAELAPTLHLLECIPVTGPETSTALPSQRVVMPTITSGYRWKPSLDLSKVTWEVRKQRRLRSLQPRPRGRDSPGAGAGPGLTSSLETHRLICVLRGQADSPAGSGAAGFLEAAALCTGTVPGSWSVKALESSGRTMGRRAPRQVPRAPGILNPPCPAGAPRRPRTPRHLSCSPPQTAA